MRGGCSSFSPSHSTGMSEESMRTANSNCEMLITSRPFSAMMSLGQKCRIAGNFGGRKRLQILWFCGYS